ncbi:MAG: nickel-dependent hydrogenase large subunit [Gammaproteobacteria bacterium]|nr:nickel-dependent hydrogenase large subunit [Gammaproteobacteria bacterium]
MGIEGFLDIQLTMNDSIISDVEIQSSRPVYASQVFLGKSVNESLSMLPLLFSICGVAQACSGIRACEQTLGRQVSAHVEHVRDSLVDMETLREHLWRILLDWPKLLDKQLLNKNLLTQEMSEIIKYQQDYRNLLTSGSNPFLLDQDIPAVSAESSQPIKQLNQLLERSIFSMSPAQWLEIDSIEKLQHWFESSETVAAHLLKKIQRNEWQGLGRNNTRGLVLELDVLESDALDFSKLYELFEDNNFVKQPQWQGTCYETSSLTRVDSILLQNLHQNFGNGLISRLVARLTEMAQIAQKLLGDVKKKAHNISQKRNDIPGDGIGVVSAARGLLMHHVSIEKNKIKKYQILAPTEWNFHPQGVVTQSLVGLQGDTEQINSQVDLIINAIDPCVGYKFHIV